MKIISVIVLGIFFLKSFVIAGNYNDISELGSSAKMIALGTVQGFSNDASSIFENPAQLHHIDNYSVSLFSTTILEEVNYHTLNFAKKTTIGTFGIGYYIKYR